MPGSTFADFAGDSLPALAAWVATADGNTVYAGFRTPNGQKLMRSVGGGSWSDLGVAAPDAAVCPKRAATD